MPTHGDYQYHTTKSDLERKLEAVINMTLGEVDTAHVFDRAQENKKITGIAGDVIEQSVIGYPANSSPDPDLVVDGEEVELKTTGLRKSKKMRGLAAKEPMSITAVSVETIAGEDFEHSNFWHKVRRMLLVYYLYDSLQFGLAPKGLIRLSRRRPGYRLCQPRKGPPTGRRQMAFCPCLSRRPGGCCHWRRQGTLARTDGNLPHHPMTAR